MAVTISDSDESNGNNNAGGNTFEFDEKETDNFEKTEEIVQGDVRVQKILTCITHTTQMSLANDLKTSEIWRAFDALRCTNEAHTRLQKKQRAAEGVQITPGLNMANPNATLRPRPAITQYINEFFINKLL